jgi:exopolyphosphatase/guanosine-5'-triphosphate,3'-diphosphate pyrophosphatase
VKASSRRGAAGRVVAFVDMGTNSVRLLIVRVRPNHSYTVLNSQKEVIRLGDHEFTERRLQKAAMDRAVLVCRRFVELAKVLGAQEVIAVATSATREARNKEEFLRRLKQESGLEVHPISGREEARLIYLGVSSGLHIGKKRALLIDIGGGSTELILADQEQVFYLDSLRLGAIRVTSLFLEDDEGAVDDEEYEAIRRHVERVAVVPLKRLARRRIEMAVGSSGTIENLAEIAARKFQGRKRTREDVLSREQLRKVVKMICALPLDRRRKIKGMNPERADIIIGGAAILETVMDELDLDEVQISDRGLKDGLLVDYLGRRGAAPHLTKLSVRERSVLQLARACQFDETHARVVQRLSLELFDEARHAGLHSYGAPERELLGYAALLHDIGVFLSFDNHHEHTWYLVKNADLLGFDQVEVGQIAALAYFHRRNFAESGHPKLKGLSKKERGIVERLSVLLRIAESLDRSRAAAVSHATLRRDGEKKLVLEMKAVGDCHLELWSAESQAEAVKAAFGRKLKVKVRQGRRAGKG